MHCVNSDLFLNILGPIGSFFNSFPVACLLLQMLLFNEVIELSFASKGSIYLFIAGLARLLGEDC